MPFVVQQPIRDVTAPYVFHKEFLTPEECQKVIDLSKTLPKHEARVGAESIEGQLDPSKRKTDLYWINWNPELNWLFEKLSIAVSASNDKFWGYHLAGFNEALQLTHYKGDTNDFYDWHEDHGDSGTFLLRKLSCVLPLNDGYNGGDFELRGVGKVEDCTKGSLIIFPSFKTHRVTPVTSGERWSLVCWLTGPPFV
jgi:hypothetical protein